MKKYFFAFIGSLFFGIFGSASAAIPDGLVAFYPFDSTPNDRSGVSEAIDLDNAPFTEDPEDSNNQVLYLNGVYPGSQETSHGYRADAHISQFNYNQFTASTDFHALTFNTAEQKDTILVGGDSYRWLGLRYSGHKLQVTLNNQGFVHTIVGVELQVGKWYNISVSFDLQAKVILVMLDGVLVDTINLNSGFTLEVIGSAGDQSDRNFLYTDYGSGSVFHGYVDNLIVFNRALSTDEMRDLYNLDDDSIAPDVQPYASVLPGSRSAQIGQTVTAFATMINAGTDKGEDCALRPVTPVPGEFSYQITDPATNRLIGLANIPRDIPAGAAQSFVFAFTPDAALAPTDVELRFDCRNSGPADVVTGLNTFLLSASAQPVPDVVALGATIDANGIANIPGANGTGVFSVASVNLGVGGTIRVSADTGSTELPVRLLLCQTDPASGACFQDPASEVTTEIAANATPTFGIFIVGTGPVAFDPAEHRVFVRFRDQAGLVRGATSVAVRTQ